MKTFDTISWLLLFLGIGAGFYAIVRGYDLYRRRDRRRPDQTERRQAPEGPPDGEERRQRERRVESPNQSDS